MIIKNLEQLNLFVTPVWVCNVDLDNDSMYKKIKQLEKDTSTVYHSNFGGYQSAKSRYDMMTTDETFKPLRRLILHIIEKELNFKAKKFEINSMWCNVNYENNFNMLHAHGHNDFSLVYYVKVPENSGVFVMRDPRPAAICSENILEQFNGGDCWKVEPEVGKLIIFPAYLDHMVWPSKSKEDRVSISGNVELTK